MTPLYIDTETYSALSLKEVGTYRYAENAEIMLITWAIGDGPVQLWDHNDGILPPDFATYIPANNMETVAGNAMFDRNVLRLGNLRIDIPIPYWRCTMVQAYQHALPGSLEEQGEVLGLAQDQKKTKRGKELIKRFCKPAPSNHKAERYTRETHPAEWEEFKEYAKQDIITLRAIHKLLPTWNWTPEDIAQWHLDQVINDRGFNVDVDLVQAGARAAIEEKETLSNRFAELTNGLKPTQRAESQKFINQKFGLSLTSTAKEYLAPIAADETKSPQLREIAAIMLSANKTSTAKYAAIAQALSADNRFRGGLQFAGAQRTRRWAGRVFQPQNLPSRNLPKGDMIEAYIDCLKMGCYKGLFDDPMLYGAAALRGVVIP